MRIALVGFLLLALSGCAAFSDDSTESATPPTGCR